MPLQWKYRNEGDIGYSSYLLPIECNVNPLIQVVNPLIQVKPYLYFLVLINSKPPNSSQILPLLLAFSFLFFHGRQ